MEFGQPNRMTCARSVGVQRPRLRLVDGSRHTRPRFETGIVCQLPHYGTHRIIEAGNSFAHALTVLAYLHAIADVPVFARTMIRGGCIDAVTFTTVVLRARVRVITVCGKVTPTGILMEAPGHGVAAVDAARIAI